MSDEVNSIDVVSLKRLWNSLDAISEKLAAIDHQLTEVVRLQERVSMHEQAINRMNDSLNTHGSRVRDIELHQANFGDKAFLEKTVVDIQRDLVAYKTTVDKKFLNIEGLMIRNSGQHGLLKEMIKWAVGIFTAIVIYEMTTGGVPK